MSDVSDEQFAPFVAALAAFGSAVWLPMFYRTLVDRGVVSPMVELDVLVWLLTAVVATGVYNKLALRISYDSGGETLV